MPQGFTIAIDGPVAAGKGTIAPLLAQTLKGFYLYTGGTYRGVALYCIENNIDANNLKKVESNLSKINVELENEKVFLNGKDVTGRIKEEDVARIVSIVSLSPKVREKMVLKQRETARSYIEKGKIIIAEGRDIGTKVFPHAELKIFLTARAEIRAKRRLDQFKQMGIKTDYETVLSDIKRRDKIDEERDIDPLLSNPEEIGYFVLDDSNLSETETLKVVLEEIKKRGLMQ